MLLLATALLIGVVGPSSASENVSSKWNWWAVGDLRACGKGSTHDPATSVASGRGFSWVSDGSNCDATPVSATSEVQNELGYLNGATWVDCDWAEDDWASTVVRITETANGPCPSGKTYYTMSTFGTCIIGDCYNSATCNNDPPGGTCGDKNFFPLTSPGHSW